MISLIKTTILAATTFLSALLPMPTFTEGMVGQPNHLNPLTAGTNKVDRDLVRLLFRGLTKYDKEGNLVGDLASSWEISADGKEYTFKLKKDVFWHDGMPFSADDVIFTASQFSQLREILVDKLDSHTVRFRLKDPFAPFLDILTLGIIPAHLPGKMGDFNPIGTGDYRLVRLKKNGKIEEITLQSKHKRINFRFYDRQEDLEMAAKLGEIDAFLTEGPLEFAWPTFNFFQAPLRSRSYAVFINLSSSATLQNKELRQDLARTAPKERILKEVLLGLGETVDSPLSGSWVLEEEEESVFDPNPERKYDTKVTLTIPKSRLHEESAKILEEAWERLGVYLKIKEVEVKDITDKVIKPKDFELLLLGQEVSRDGDVYTFWHSTQKDLPGLNFTSFTQARADKALEAGRKEMSREARITHYQNFQKIFTEEVPAIFLYQPYLTYVVREDILGVDLSPLFNSPDRFWNLSDWKF